MDHSWYALNEEALFHDLNTHAGGISHLEAKKRLEKYGLNKIQMEEGTSLWSLLFRQFLNPIVVILIIATCIKFTISNALDGSVLAGTILLMITIEFVQEAKAEHAMRSLKKLTAHKCKVKRDGNLVMIVSEEIVPGDVIILETGDKIPADARIIECSNLRIDESTFNGESMPIEKHAEALTAVHSMIDRRNMVYMGTSVSAGRGVAVVVGTAMDTELGKIASSIKEIKPEKTPLQKSVQAIGVGLVPIIFVAIGIFSWICLYRGMYWIDVILLSIAAAVSAIPEGLMAAFTVALANGMNNMAKRHAIIRKIIAVETLGSTTVICSDKTGTLTHNQMTVTKLYLPSHLIKVAGSGKSIKGEFTLDGDRIDPKKESGILKMIEIGALCNDALLTKTKGNYDVIGDPTEGALLITALKAGIDQDKLKSEYQRIDEIPFMSENFYMASLHATDNGQVLLVKGASEKVLLFSQFVLKNGSVIPMTKMEREAIEKEAIKLSESGYRLLSVAYCPYTAKEEALSEESFKDQLIFAGIFAMIDPPRQEAIDAIASCKQAGIKVVMITGDNKLTAEAVAEKLGIQESGALSGDEIEQMSESELIERIGKVNVFARVEPLHKLRIVQAFKARGEVVAMTGDGVNDAPALEAADIGIAMGINGTDVAKEAADMILSNDNFASIVEAIEEGRVIFKRLRNVCALLLTTCFGELLGLILCSLFIGTAPLVALQILWVNLVTGVIISIPLSLEPKSGDELTHPPRDPQVNLIYPGMLYRIAFLAIMLAGSIFFIFKYVMTQTDLATARSIVLTSVVVFEWLIAFNMRSDELAFYRQGIFRNISLFIAILGALLLQLIVLYVPFFHEPFSTQSLSLHDWLIALLPGVAIFVLETLRKEWFPKLFSKGKWKN
jgi:Ca2+-transporting ATPase